MEQSPSWEVNRFSASQKIPRILGNPKIYYHIHKYPPPVPTLSQLDQSIAPHPTSWRSILIRQHSTISVLKYFITKSIQVVEIKIVLLRNVTFYFVILQLVNSLLRTSTWNKVQNPKRKWEPLTHQYLPRANQPVAFDN